MNPPYRITESYSIIIRISEYPLHPIDYIPWAAFRQAAFRTTSWGNPRCQTTSDYLQVDSRRRVAYGANMPNGKF